jgi:hypothetical protein
LANRSITAWVLSNDRATSAAHDYLLLQGKQPGRDISNMALSEGRHRTPLSGCPAVRSVNARNGLQHISTLASSSLPSSVVKSLTARRCGQEVGGHTLPPHTLSLALICDMSLGTAPDHH